MNVIETIDFICVLGLFGVSIGSIIVSFIYRRKLNAYRNQEGTILLYKAEKFIDYNKEEDRKYLVFQKNLEIYKIVSYMPIIVFVLQLAFLADAILGIMVLCIGAYKFDKIKKYIIKQGNSYRY